MFTIGFQHFLCGHVNLKVRNIIINSYFLFSIVAIETTGSSNEFYDKFSIRYHISIIFKAMWMIPSHQMKMIDEAK